MYSKLTADEQGFWFATGVVLLVALLLAAHYDGPIPEAVRVIAVLMAFGDAWIVREEIAYPHWEEVPDEKEPDEPMLQADLLGRDFSGNPFE